MVQIQATNEYNYEHIIIRNQDDYMEENPNGKVINIMLELKEITKDTFDDVVKLKVAKNQENFVSSTVLSLAQAWVYKNTAFPFAIYEDDLLVGFIMLGYYEIKNQYTLWKFMIDEQYQKRGYGKKALELAIKYLINNFKVKEVFTGVDPQNAIAKKLYCSVGFDETGEFDEFQIEMKLVIDSHDTKCL